MFKKIIYIFTLSLFVYQSFFSYFTFEWSKACIRAKNFSAAASDATQKNYEIFTFSNGEKINWEVENKELWIGKKLYDVREIQADEDKILIVCEADMKEESLVKNYLSQQIPSSDHSGVGDCLKKIIHSIYLKPDDIFCLLFPNPLPDVTERFFEWKSVKQQKFTSILFPPPEFFFKYVALIHL